MTRRAALGASLAVLAAPAARATSPSVGPDSDQFTYEVTRSDAEWRAMLEPEQHRIMREGGTEWSKTSELWDRYGPGQYACAGCNLKVYDEAQRRPLDKGWVFFRHAEPNAVLMDLDRAMPTAYGGSGEEVPGKELIEVHCRRCGSHLGHILNIGGIVHCINGIALTFTEAKA